MQTPDRDTFSIAFEMLHTQSKRAHDDGQKNVNIALRSEEQPPRASESQRHEQHDDHQSWHFESVRRQAQHLVEEHTRADAVHARSSALGALKADELSLAHAPFVKVDDCTKNAL